MALKINLSQCFYRLRKTVYTLYVNNFYITVTRAFTCIFHKHSYAYLITNAETGNSVPSVKEK